MDDEYVDMDLSIVQTGFLWFKKIHFEITCENRTDYYYTVGDLVSTLIDREVPKFQIWRVVNNIMTKYYKVK